MGDQLVHFTIFNSVVIMAIVSVVYHVVRFFHTFFTQTTPFLEILDPPLTK